VNDTDMGFLEHLWELRRRIIRCLIFFFAIFLFTFVMGPKKFTFLGREIPIVYPSSESFSSLFIEKFLLKLAPENVIVVQMRPQEAIISQIYVSMVLAFILGFPLYSLEMWKFVSPALTPEEKKYLAKSSIPALFLFLSGCSFSYLILAPWILNFLYVLGKNMGIETYLTLSSLVSFTLFLSLSFGLVFQMPLLMYLLTRLGVVSKKTWSKHWKIAFFLFLLFGAVITPDGSGVTQLMVALPMMGLYLGGILLSKTVRK